MNLSHTFYDILDEVKYGKIPSGEEGDQCACYCPPGRICRCAPDSYPDCQEELRCNREEGMVPRCVQAYGAGNA